MNLHCLKYALSIPDCGPVPAVLEITGPEDLTPLLALAEPMVYLVQSDDARRISKIKKGIVERGRKHPAKSLSVYLLKKEGVPIIDGNFTGTTQVKRSVKTLLANANKAKEFKLFLISVQSAVFNRIEKVIATGGADNQNTAPMVRSSRIKDSIYLGDSEKIEKVRQNIAVAAKVDYPVLILGPPGSGKELVANEIHRKSGRAANNMITVNCSAIPEQLLESELFGYKKGAFSGAVSDRTGKWKLADRGTLFLDEIGDLKPDHQVKILRAISTNSFYPVGSEKPESADVRILSATNRDIHPSRHKTRFREDLYYRLCGIIIQTPALNDHAEDIPGLVDRIWPQIVEENMDEKKKQHPTLNPTLSADVVSQLKTMRWPGNVRQLKNILRRLYAYVGELKPITAQDLSAVVQYENAGVSKETEKIARIHQTKEAMVILQAVEATLDFRIENWVPGYSQASFIENSARFHLDEIDSLCHAPLSLSEPVFLILNDLKGKLIYFSHLFSREPRDAFDYWHERVKTTIKASYDKILKEYNTFSDFA